MIFTFNSSAYALFKTNTLKPICVTLLYIFPPINLLERRFDWLNRIKYIAATFELFRPIVC